MVSYSISNKSSPAVSGPIDVAKSGAVVGEDFQNVVDEAAIVFAGGQEKEAADLLIGFLKQTNGQANRKVWFMLLDVYQALGQQDAYDRLSLMFAKRFGTSPPSWEEALGMDASKSAGSNAAADSSKAGSGKNVLIVDGPAVDQIAPKTKEFIAASRELKSCKLDISRMKMEQSTPEGLTALHEIMKMLRKHKISATLMGENHVLKWLLKKIEDTKDSVNINHSHYWMLALEILQWRGMMEQFEELSFEYTMTFEVSGPGWEPSGVMTIEAVAEVEDHEAHTSESGLRPDDIITDVSVQRLQDMVNQSLSDKGEARLDFRHVKRMDFSAAGAFSNFLDSLGKDRAKKVVLVNPSELIIALGTVVGFCMGVSVVERKR